MKKTLLILSVALLSLNVAFSQKVAVETSREPGWHKVGETTANFKSDRDAITVVGADAFRTLKLKVTDAPVHIGNMEIVFENEEMQTVELDVDLKRGEESRVIGLVEGEKRRIKKVIYHYRTIPNWPVDKAHIELWGLK